MACRQPPFCGIVGVTEHNVFMALDVVSLLLSSGWFRGQSSLTVFRYLVYLERFSGHADCGRARAATGRCSFLLTLPASPTAAPVLVA